MNLLEGLLIIPLLRIAFSLFLNFLSILIWCIDIRSIGTGAWLLALQGIWWVCGVVCI